jgi:hypothetical protein
MRRARGRDAHEVALRLRGGGRARCSSRGAAERSSRALHGGLGFGAASRIQQRRRLRLHARHHLTAFHGIAGSSSIRSTRPATAADTTNRLRTRVTLPRRR